MNLDTEPTEELLKYAKSKQNKSKVFIAAGVVILMIAACIAGFFMFRAHQKTTFDKSLKLGEKYMSEGKYEEAAAQFEKAVKLDDSNLKAMEGLAEAYSQSGNEKKAKAAYKKIYTRTKDEKYKVKGDNVGADRKIMPQYYSTIKNNSYEVDVTSNYDEGEKKSNESIARPVAITDVNDDGRSELLYMSFEGTEEFDSKPRFHIVDNEDNTAKEIEYHHVAGDNNFDEYDEFTGFTEYGAGAGSFHAIFKTKEPALVILSCSYGGDPVASVYNNLSEYKLNGSSLELVNELVYSVMLDDQKKYEDFTLNGETMDDEEGMKFLKARIDNIESVFFRRTKHESGDSFGDEYGLFEWTALDHAELAGMPYSDMIRKLSAHSDADEAAYGRTIKEAIDLAKAGKGAEANKVLATLPEYLTENCVRNMSDEEKEAYEGVLSELRGTNAYEEAGDMGFEPILEEYGYMDIDNDGDAELFTRLGTCEADYRGRFYDYRDGKVVKVLKEDFPMGHSSISVYPGYSGWIHNWGHMGATSVSLITYKDGKTTGEEICSSTDEQYDDPNVVHIFKCFIETKWEG